MSKNQKSLGKLPPQYNFFLNPYDNLRFSRCPNCHNKTGQKKLPLVIWVDTHYPVSLNYTCRYCSHCDLLIAHQNKIENLLAQIFQKQNPEIIGSHYLVIGTMEKPAWKDGTRRSLDPHEMLNYQHDFKQVLKFEILPAGWYPNEKVLKPIDKEATINDKPKTKMLIEKMNLAVLIPTRPTKELVNALRKQGVQLDRYHNVQIKKVFDMGDEGGIMCDITPLGKEKTPILCSLTQLLISPSHLLLPEIRAYQEKRIQTLAKNSGVAGFTITRRNDKTTNR